MPYEAQFEPTVAVHDACSRGREKSRETIALIDTGLHLDDLSEHTGTLLHGAISLAFIKRYLPLLERQMIQIQHHDDLPAIDLPNGTACEVLGTLEIPCTPGRGTAYVRLPRRRWNMTCVVVDDLQGHDLMIGASGIDTFGLLRKRRLRGYLAAGVGKIRPPKKHVEGKGWGAVKGSETDSNQESKNRLHLLHKKGQPSSTRKRSVSLWLMKLKALWRTSYQAVHDELRIHCSAGDLTTSQYVCEFSLSDHGTH
jgi:hypothetical protein